MQILTWYSFILVCLSFILVFINPLQGPSYALAAGIEDEVYQESMNTNLRKRN